MESAVLPLRWVGEADDGYLEMLDQRLLPKQEVWQVMSTAEDVADGIRDMVIRGAPAIGIAAAYGACVGMQPLYQEGSSPSEPEWFARLDEVVKYLASSRPTAVNLFWALDRMQRLANTLRGARTPEQMYQEMLAEAKLIHEEDRRQCRDIGRYGAELLQSGQGVLTHCNAGGLATADYGTALAVFFAASEAGKEIHVFADETRPLLQGARLTAWELNQRSIPVTLICDSMAPLVMRQGKVQAVVVGADRIAANGDTANKIGTYGVALAARSHGIPFYVAAPSSTFDLTLDSGDRIPIEERDPREITHGFGTQTGPEGIDVYNPAFDVTPAEMIEAFITEKGILRPVDRETIARHLEAKTSIG
jgi:methylthioribose-1-phosphate isomerase